MCASVCMCLHVCAYVCMCALAGMYFCRLMGGGRGGHWLHFPSDIHQVNDRSNKCLHVGENCCFSLHVGVLLQRMVLTFNAV